ncbi:MAG: signal peptidase I [Paracoccaceae bacterium]
MATEETAQNGFIETIKTIVYALLIAGVFRTLFFQPFWIPSGSMKETLLIGDFLFVNKMAYGYSAASCKVPIFNKSICPFVTGRIFEQEPDRGDVVVFSHPVSGQDYIKRLVGMPGDRIQVKDGILFINGTAATQQPDGAFTEDMARQGPQGILPSCANGPVGEGGPCAKERFVETFPDGHSHKILNIRNQGTDNTGVFIVPEREYFFMGDNRDNSLDSRTSQLARGVGTVPFENLIGRADRIMFSSGGRSMFFFWTWRSDRFFKAVE